MESTILDKIAATPWWVFLVFIMVARGAYNASKPREFAYKHIRFAGIIMAILVPLAIWYTHELQTPRLITFAISAIIGGSMLGWLRFRMLKLTIIKDSYTFITPGSWYGYFLLIALLYYFLSHDTSSINPSALNPYLIWLPTLYGLTCGLYLGKYTYLRKRFKSA